MNLKDNLKKIRKDNNLSQEDLAEKLGVSRQSVSKWEQGIAYPEMDKVLQLCKMFNLNIDEILNQDIDNVERNKKSKVNVNKYIDEFLNFVTKTVKMFGSMKFKDKVKCIFEQLFIIFILVILFLVTNELFTHIIDNIFGFIHGNLYYIIMHLFDAIFYIIYIIFAVVVILHIFKIRYLDYYVIADKEEVVEEKEEEEEVKEEIIQDKKQEKIIIRDPNHSSYGFIHAIAKVLLYIIKAFAVLVGLTFCLSMIGFVVLFVISFLFIKTGLLFVGALLGLIGCIIINLIVLNLIYCFISNTKCNKRLSFVGLILSLIIGGIACGLILISIKDFEYVNEIDDKNYVVTSEEIDFNNNMIIQDYYENIEYVESNNNNLKIEYYHLDYCEIILSQEDNYVNFYRDCGNEFEVAKKILNNLQNKTITDPMIYKIKIYTSKKNIDILNTNRINYYKKIDEENELNNSLYREIENLNNEIDVLNDKLSQYEE